MSVLNILADSQRGGGVLSRVLSHSYPDDDATWALGTKLCTLSITPPLVF
jgi:hypothetical protein